MRSLTAFVQESVLKCLTKNKEKSTPLGTPGKILTEKEEKESVDLRLSACGDNEVGPVERNCSDDKASGKAFDETGSVNNKVHDDVDVKGIVYDPLDIRVIFYEAIEDFYNYSENGGPSSYEEKLVLLLEGYLKQNRGLPWDEKLNRLEIRKFVFSNIEKLSRNTHMESFKIALPLEPKAHNNKEISRNTYGTKKSSSFKTALPPERKVMDENECSNRISGVRKEGPLEIIEIKEEKKRFRGVRKFFSSLFCRRKKHHPD